MRNQDKLKQTTFDVWLNGKCIDTLTYGYAEKVEEVYKSLVNHDGYDSRIKVTKRKESGNAAR